MCQLNSFAPCSITFFIYVRESGANSHTAPLAFGGIECLVIALSEETKRAPTSVFRDASCPKVYTDRKYGLCIHSLYLEALKSLRPDNLCSFAVISGE